MPVLSDSHSASERRDHERALIEPRFEDFGLGLFGRCANPNCRSGWLHLFRRRSRPCLEGGWTCSPECTEARFRLAVRRELESGASIKEPYRHRIPLGLLMLEKGLITSQQLRSAVGAQRASGSGRLGEWLVRLNAANEATVTRALGLQWSCPVLSMDFAASAALTGIMPRLLVDAVRVLPVKIAGRSVLYLGFEESLDPVMAFALERVTGLRVESGIVASTAFRTNLESVRKCRFAPVQLAEATSEAAAAHLFTKALERMQPVDACLVRVHEFLWLRLFSSDRRSAVPSVSSVSDVICTVRAPKNTYFPSIG